MVHINLIIIPLLPTFIYGWCAVLRLFSLSLFFSRTACLYTLCALLSLSTLSFDTRAERGKLSLACYRTRERKSERRTAAVCSLQWQYRKLQCRWSRYFPYNYKRIQDSLQTAFRLHSPKRPEESTSHTLPPTPKPHTKFRMKLFTACPCVSITDRNPIYFISFIRMIASDERHEFGLASRPRPLCRSSIFFMYLANICDYFLSLTDSFCSIVLLLDVYVISQHFRVLSFLNNYLFSDKKNNINIR